MQKAREISISACERERVRGSFGGVEAQAEFRNGRQDMSWLLAS